ncbi:hypothetical protein ACFL2E_09965 [Thermodesulfobacteriota bacterium]
MLSGNPIYTIVAIIIPFTSSKTTNLLRCLTGLFGFAGIRKKRYYTFMATALAVSVENDSRTVE